MYSPRNFPFSKEHHVWFIFILHSRFSLVVLPTGMVLSNSLQSHHLRTCQLWASLHDRWSSEVCSTPDVRFYLFLYVFTINFWQVAQPHFRGNCLHGTCQCSPVSAVCTCSVSLKCHLSLWTPNQTPRHLLVTVEASTGGGPVKDRNMDCSWIWVKVDKCFSLSFSHFIDVEFCPHP